MRSGSRMKLGEGSSKKEEGRSKKGNGFGSSRRKSSRCRENMNKTLEREKQRRPEGSRSTTSRWKLRT